MGPCTCPRGSASRCTQPWAQLGPTGPCLDGAAYAHGQACWNHVSIWAQMAPAGLQPALPAACVYAGAAVCQASCLSCKYHIRTWDHVQLRRMAHTCVSCEPSVHCSLLSSTWHNL